jgi:7-keto-8-aminopelargonate synthetase-like enzyme
VIRESLRIVGSDEGEQLRASLARNVLAVRDTLARMGLRCLGEPSPIVPVTVGSERVARVASRRLHERGVHANLVEFPAVAIGASRFRMQVMATHTEEQARDAATRMAEAIAEARQATHP